MNGYEVTRIEQQKKEITPFFHGLIVICLLLTAATCTNSGNQEETNNLPNQPNEIENMILISPENGALPDSVKLITEAVFESNDDVYLSGNISNFAVDNSGRVFLVSSAPGNVGVYVFHPDGSYQTSIGSFGRGPGEFEAISSIDIFGDEMILFDPRLQKFTIYSLKNLEIIREETVKLTEVTRSENMSAIAKGTHLKLLNSGKMIMEVGMSSLSEENDGKQIFYYMLDRSGIVAPERLLKVDRHKRYFLPEREGWAIPITKPFNRSSLVSITRSGKFFTAWTDDFLIKEYDTSGRYTRSMYYQATRSDFSLNQISVADHEYRMLRDEEIPDTWPALHTMELDDEGRLWVATITDSETHFKWWVLNQSGGVIARFNKPGERSSRFVPSKPLITIKDGFFYSHERDFRKGIDRIVKFRIEFVES